MKEKFDGLVDHLFNTSIFLPEAIEILERCMIRRALDANGGNQCAAAKQLGIHRNTLQRKMTEYGFALRRRPAAREARGRRPKSRLA